MLDSLYLRLALGLALLSAAVGGYLWIDNLQERVKAAEANAAVAETAVFTTADTLAKEREAHQLTAQALSDEITRSSAATRKYTSMREAIAHAPVSQCPAGPAVRAATDRLWERGSADPRDPVGTASDPGRVAGVPAGATAAPGRQ
jgi:hypothetical protein